MKKISIAFVATLSLVAFTGCKKKGADCGAAMDHAAEVAKTDPNMKMDAATMDKMKAVSVAHCKDDKWEADVVKCFSDAKDPAGLDACTKKLKPEQTEKFTKAMMEAATPAGAGDHMGSAAGSDTGSAAGSGGSAAPAAGSDMGSGSAAAGSGSAAAPAAGSDMGSGSAAAAPAAGGSAAPAAGSGSAK